MDGHVLTLFPPYGIDQTLHVAILIGLVWSLAFTELFGWSLHRAAPWSSRQCSRF